MIARFLATVGIAVTLTISVPALAADWEPFTAASFSEAQSAGKSILVDISALWCPTCRLQKPILEELTGAPEFKDLVVLKIDFYRQPNECGRLRHSHRADSWWTEAYGFGLA
jgi:thiol-disulfide isomerase/thioredoxin